MAKTINISKPFDTPDYCNFSIIIVNYNYEDHITQAIQSCIEQNYPIDSFEIIVVDDGSTDNSRAVIAETASKYQNLRVIHQNNLGQAAAFYAGVNSANNDWICLLDSDDYFKTEKLSVLNQYIRTLADNCDFICHDVDAVDEVAGIVQSWFDRQNIKTDSLSVNDAKGGYPYANPCGQVYRKTLLQKIAPWINPAEWMRGADNPLVWGAMFVSGRVHYLHQSLAVYRIHSNNFFLASTPNGLVPKVNWLERWPKLLSYLRYLNQAAASSYIVDGNRNNLLLRLEDFYQTWEQRLRFKPDVPMLSLITTCKNRLHHLKQTLPLMVKQPNAEVIVVDYGCTQGTRDWIKANYPQVKVVEVDDDSGWCLARARNLGAAEAKSDWLLFIDADVLLQGNLSAWVFENAKPDHFYRAGPLKSYSEMGTILCTKANYSAVGGYDEAYVGWAAEDGDFFAKLKDANFIASEYPSTLIKAIEHGDEERQLGKEGYVENTAQGMRVNMIYRLIKADIKKLTGSEPSLDNRKNLIKNLIAWTSEYQKSGLEKDSRFVMKLNAGLDLYQSTNLERQITYILKNPKHIFRSQVINQQSSAGLSPLKQRSSEIPDNAYLIIIGAMKCGTSSLFEYLKSHPAICPSIVKEPEFFSVKQSHKQNIKNYQDLWSFDKNKHKFAMEASTGYTKYPFENEVAKKIYEYGINPKFIYIVRDPFERIVSHCRFLSEKNIRQLSVIDKQVIATSNYYLQLEQFNQYFSDNILLLDFDDLKTSPKLVLDKVYSFLGLDLGYYPSNFRVVNKTGMGTADQTENLNDEYTLTEDDRDFIYKALRDDMEKFSNKYHFDVKKWGF